MGPTQKAFLSANPCVFLFYFSLQAFYIKDLKTGIQWRHFLSRREGVLTQTSITWLTSTPFKELVSSKILETSPTFFQDAEIARLTAMLKKTEMKAASLERSVDQKVRENEELTAICDELIAKVGSS